MSQIVLILLAFSVVAVLYGSVVLILQTSLCALFICIGTNNIVNSQWSSLFQHEMAATIYQIFCTFKVATRER